MIKRYVTFAGMLVVGLVALVWSSTARDRGISAGNAPQTQPTDTLTPWPADLTLDARVKGPPPAYRGMAIQIQSNYRVLETFCPLIDEVADLGANSVLLATAGYMEHARSQGIYLEQRRMPSKDKFVALIQYARDAGLRPVLMPMLLLANPNGREWRGRIEPPDWNKWWREYREFILYFADIAREGQAAALMVGSELVSTESETVEWVKTIEQVRGRFAGDLGYSANWDTYQVIQFWDKLDIAGMTTYFELSEHANPTVAELIQGWKPIYRDITAWQRRIGKPVIFTEVGWCSQAGSSVQPWNYYRSEKATPEGREEQRRLYEAFLTVWEGAPELGGIIWWEWTAGPGGDEDFGYTPKGKPAEAVLRDWYARCAQPRSSRPNGDAPATADPNSDDR